jgi:hypothetical protein
MRFKMQIDIRITEILSRIITVNVASLEDALMIVEDMYRKENIVLDYTDFSGNVIIEKK